MMQAPFYQLSGAWNDAPAARSSSSSSPQRMREMTSAGQHVLHCTSTGRSKGDFVVAVSQYSRPGEHGP